MSAARASLVGMGLVAVASAIWTLALTGPGWGATDALPAGAFHASHAFFARHLATVPSGGALLYPPLGWPSQPSVPLIGGVPLAVGAALQWLGPLRAYSMALLVGPMLTAAATWGWLRAVVEGHPVARGLAALSFTTCAFAVGALGNGQLAKLQLWVLPAALWALAAFQSAPGTLRGGVLLGTCVVGVGTAPSLAVQLPIAAALQVATTLPRRSEITRTKLLSAGGGLGLVGVGMLPGLAYLGAEPNGGTRPAVAGTGARVGGAAPSASLDDLLLGVGARADGLDAVNHAPVLSLAALVAGLVLAGRQGRGRGVGLGLLGVGGLLALGPELRWGADVVSLGGWTLDLPAKVLAHMGYPMGQTGQWYRFVAMGSLGLAALVARARTPLAVVAVALAATGSAVQAVVQSGHSFPRPAVSVVAYDTMVALQSAPGTGAVVVLPLLASTVDGGPGLAMAAVSGRSTSAMARHSQDHPATVALRALLQQAHATHTPQAAQRVLADAGVAVVVWRPGARVMRGEVWLDPDAVAQDLGQPVVDGGASVWWVHANP